MTVRWIVSAALMLAACGTTSGPIPPAPSTSADVVSDACRQAGPLCRPPAQTTAAGCIGRQKTGPAIGIPDAIGPGPAYPSPYPLRAAPLDRSTPDTPFNGVPMDSDAEGNSLPGGPWHGNKVLWWVSADYTGGVLIRTFAVGHDGRARIQRDEFADAAYLASPPPDRQPIVERHAFDYPTQMWVSGPGCYVWQVDGADFSYVIYFNAVLDAVG